LKKRNKKLLQIGARLRRGLAQAANENGQELFASFSRKRSTFLLSCFGRLP
jgi:hypothetical protein